MRFFLFDAVLEVERGRRMLASKHVNLMDGYLEGHYPGQPILPPTLLIEALAQAAGMLNTYNHNYTVEMVLMLVDNVQIRRPVRQGERLLLEITMLYDHPYGATMSGEVRVDGGGAGEEIVASAERIVFAHEVTEDPAKIKRARERFIYQTGRGASGARLPAEEGR